MPHRTRFGGYDEPEDLANDTSLSLGQRLDALKNWKGWIMRVRQSASASEQDYEQILERLEIAVSKIESQRR